MTQKTVIVITDGTTRRVFSNLRAACNAYGWKYNTLSRKGKSFNVGDLLVERIEVTRSGH